jgi:hypothetical protein
VTTRRVVDCSTSSSAARLSRLKTDKLADVVQVTKARVLKALERRGVVRVGPEALEVADALANRAPLLAHWAAAVKRRDLLSLEYVQARPKTRIRCWT